MNYELSILIPIYNDDPRGLVGDLLAQCEAIEGLKYEIIIGDDGSGKELDISNILGFNEDSTCHKSSFNEDSPCRVLRFNENRGRAAIRNSLAGAAKYQRLLFIDGGHMRVECADFIERYLNSGDAVVYGGYALSAGEGLRYRYETSTKQINFHTCNFLINKELMLAIPFNEAYKKYGFEDVLFGRDLELAGHTVSYIDNPTTFTRYESNEVYLRKTLESIETQKEHSEELFAYSRLLQAGAKIRRWHMTWFFKFLYRHFIKQMERNLLGQRPNMLIFKLFKLAVLLA